MGPLSYPFLEDFESIIIIITIIIVIIAIILLIIIILLVIIIVIIVIIIPGRLRISVDSAGSGLGGQALPLALELAVDLGHASPRLQEL